MTTTFDQHGINHMTVAISDEMTPQGRSRHADADTLFMGGATPCAADQNELAGFGLRKNYRIIFPSFDPANVAAGPIGFMAVVTDGVAESFVLLNGRLWKRNRKSAAILRFPGIQGVLKITAKGRLLVRPMAGQYHDHGYELALEDVRARAARMPGHIPVVSPIGGMLTVIDKRTLADTFAGGE